MLRLGQARARSRARGRTRTCARPRRRCSAWLGALGLCAAACDGTPHGVSTAAGGGEMAAAVGASGASGAKALPPDDAPGGEAGESGARSGGEPGAGPIAETSPSYGVVACAADAPRDAAGAPCTSSGDAAYGLLLR